MSNMKNSNRHPTSSLYPPSSASSSSAIPKSGGKQLLQLSNKSNNPATSTSTAAAYPSERNSTITYLENKRDSSSVDKTPNTVSNNSNVKTISKGTVEYSVTPDEKPFSFLPNSVSPRPPLGSRPQGFGPNFTPLKTENNYLSAPGSMNSSGLDLSLSLSVELEADLLVKQYHKNRKVNATAAATSLAMKKKIIDNNDNNNNVNDNKINSSSRSKGKINKKEKSILSLSQSQSQSPPRSGRDSRGGGKSPIQNQNNWNSSQSLKNDIPNGSQLRRSADDDALGTYVHRFLSFSVNFIIFYFRIR